MTSKFILAAGMACAMLTGCSQKPYNQQIDDMSVPTAKAEISKQCGQLRSEISRQHRVEAINPSPLIMAIASKNIAALENRAALLRCSAAFSSYQAEPGNPIEQCITACEANTSKSADECFTVCNH